MDNKISTTFKGIAILVALLFLNVSLFAKDDFVLHTNGLVNHKTITKIQLIGSEVEEKLQNNLYVYVTDDNKIDTKLPRNTRIKLMNEFTQNIINGMTKKSYAILVISLKQKYVGILSSKDLEKLIDKDDILGNYVIPLLVSHDKNKLISKISAASLNGYNQMADMLSNAKGITLQNTIKGDGEIIRKIWKYFMYITIFGGMAIYGYAVYRQRKYKK